VLQAKNLSQERVEWGQPHLIEVGYDPGHIRQFGSLWHSDDVREGPYYVEIKLKCRSPGFGSLNPKDGNP
jgi:hypothetical protein